MTGVIVINKEQDFTSFDVVAVMRGITKEKKIGHTGTLDPMATGVLPILLGRATKACDLLPDSDKTYVAKFKLGIKTDTGDIWGKETETKDFSVSQEELEKALEGFRGDIWQLPPMYSAVSVNGQRLYKLARQGIEVEREKRMVNISALNLLSFDGECGEIEISCSKGTYIRTLIEDIAQSLGTVATMTALTRTKACGFDISESISLDELRQIVKDGKLESSIKDVEFLFEECQVITISEAQAKRFSNGGALDLQRLKLPRIMFRTGDIVRVYHNDFIALGKMDVENNCMKFLKSFR